MSGIVSYGAYIPSHKIETGEIASVWGADGSAWAKNLNVYSKLSKYLAHDEKKWLASFL